MDYRTITSLMLRIAGVLILVQLVSAAPQTITNLLHFGGKETTSVDVLALTALALVLPLAIGLALIYFPSAITNRIVRTGDEGEAKAVSESLLPVAIACLGVYFVSVALYDGVYWLFKLRLYYIFEETHQVGTIPLAPGDFAGMASAAFQFIIGLVLMLGSGGISRLVIRLRS